MTLSKAANLLICATWMFSLGTQIVQAQDTNSESEKRPHRVELAGGRMLLTAPGEWKAVEPSVRIIEHEFTIPSGEEDEKDNKDAAGRLTVMPAGGSIEANIERWFGQFKQPDNKPTKDRAKTEKTKIDGITVHLVDVTGTFLDRRGPFAPAEEKERYRMLAAILETEGAGNYFIKLTGPERTIAHNEKHFRSFVKSLRKQP